MAVAWNWNFNSNRRVDIAAAVEPPPIPDAAWQRLLKAVPVTAVSFVTGATPFWVAAEGSLRTALLVTVFTLGLLFGVVEMTYLRKVGFLEIGVAIAAYLVWTYALGGYFDLVHLYQPLVAGVLVIAFVTALIFLTPPNPAP